MTAHRKFWNDWVVLCGTTLIVLGLSAFFHAMLSVQAQQPTSTAAYDAVAYEAITVSTTSIGITAAVRAPSGISTDFCYVTTEAQSIRWTTNGTTPTSTVGHLAAAGAVISLLGPPDITAFRMIRQGGVDATVQVTCSRRLSP